MRGDGRVFRRGGCWWLAYYCRGREYREPGGRTEAEARRRLRKRLGEIHVGAFVTPESERITVSDLLDGLETHLKLKSARSLQPISSHLRVVKDAFALERASDITTDRVERYQSARIAEGKANATVNREVGLLRQAFRLAMKSGRLARVPFFPMLREDNARQGFFERSEVDALVAALPEPYDDAVRFAFLSAWRRGEIAALAWSSVDRVGRTITLRITKNGRPRTLPLEGELWEIIERRWRCREHAIADDEVALSNLVFHRAGLPLGDWRKAWATACKATGLEGKLFHDLRRSAIRNMVRAGVPQSVAMRISGHVTTSVFLRYDIASEEDKRAALQRTAAYLAAQPSQRTVEPLRAAAGENTDRTRTIRVSRGGKTTRNPASKQAPRAGLEPATNRLTADRSTN